jgi:hypothetical protein
MQYIGLAKVEGVAVGLQSCRLRLVLLCRIRERCGCLGCLSRQLTSNAGEREVHAVAS